jgi:hypothetical protein
MTDKKIIDYHVYSTTNKDLLHTVIPKKLKEGWSLYGNPWSDVEYENGASAIADIWIHQALVRYE